MNDPLEAILARVESDDWGDTKFPLLDDARKLAAAIRRVLELDRQGWKGNSDYCDGYNAAVDDVLRAAKGG